ncbi:unnamed protein product, partial [Closterium sp. Naga37s-1]
VDRQKILNWVHSLKVLDPELLQAKKIGGIPVTRSTATPPPIAEATASISTLSVQAGADVASGDSGSGGASMAHNAVALCEATRERETSALCASSSYGPLGLGADVLGFRGSPSIGVEYSTRGAPKQSPYDCSHIAMTYTALAILATLNDEPVPSLPVSGDVCNAGSSGGSNASCTADCSVSCKENSVVGCCEGERAGCAGEEAKERGSEGPGARCGDGVDAAVCGTAGERGGMAGEVRGMAKSLLELQLQDGSFMPVACGSESDMRFVFCAGEGWLGVLGGGEGRRRCGRIT